MAPQDAASMEASLIAAADVDIRVPLFERFFVAFPERRASFIAVGAAWGSEAGPQAGRAALKRSKP